MQQPLALHLPQAGPQRGLAGPGGCGGAGSGSGESPGSKAGVISCREIAGPAPCTNLDHDGAELPGPPCPSVLPHEAKSAFLPPPPPKCIRTEAVLEKIRLLHAPFSTEVMCQAESDFLPPFPAFSPSFPHLPGTGASIHNHAEESVHLPSRLQCSWQSTGGKMMFRTNTEIICTDLIKLEWGTDRKRKEGK